MSAPPAVTVAVFIEREHSAPDFAVQKLRQHTRVVAAIEATVRPRKFIQEKVDGTRTAHGFLPFLVAEVLALPEFRMWLPE